MSNIYDPSDIDNDINGFNIVECCTFKPTDLYIMIPNLGYGFIANVLNSFEETKVFNTNPRGHYSIQRTVNDVLTNAREAGQLSATAQRFAPLGTGWSAEHMVMKIPLNSPCARKIKVDPPVKLPLVFKVRDTSDSSYVRTLMSHPAFTDYQVTLFGMQTSVLHKAEEGIENAIMAGLASMHLRAASDLYRNKPPEGSTEIPESPNTFTGKIQTSGDRVEFTHFFTGEGGLLHHKEYFEIISNPSSEVPWGESTLRAAVFLGFNDDSGKPRLYYSPDLTKSLIHRIELEGMLNPPSLRFNKSTYAFGLGADASGSMQGWLNYVAQGTESPYIAQPGWEDMYLESIAMPQESVHNEILTSNITDLQIVDRTTGTGEQTETITLLTPGPPLLTKGQIYRDSPEENDDAWYLPMSHAYLLPLASYARAATETQEACEFCGGTKYAGYTHCAVCNGGEGIRCPNCLENKEVSTTGAEVYVPGFISEDCPICAADTNIWTIFTGVASVFPPEVGKMPCPECATRALQNALRSGDVIAEFRRWLGKESDGTGTCGTCSGAGRVPCEACVNTPDEELRGTPGIARTKCNICNDDSVLNILNYRGFSTPKPGYMKCNDSNLEFAGTESQTQPYYGHFHQKHAPTCGDSKYVKEDCPACEGGLLSYKFRAIDFSSADEVDERYDEGNDYTISASDATSSNEARTNLPLDLPYVTECTVPAAADGNIAVYAKLPQAAAATLKTTDPTWRDDAVTGDSDDDIIYKWLPPYMFKLEGTTLKIFRRLPPGTFIRYYTYPSFTLTGSEESPGYIELDAANAPAVEDTIYDAGAWLYVKDQSDVPIISGTRCLTTSQLFRYTYKNASQIGANAHRLYHHEGFAHLAHGIHLYYNILKKPQYKDLLQSVGTARTIAIPHANSLSRWLYAPNDPSKTLTATTNDTSWVKLTNFEDVTDFDVAFITANSDRNVTREEWNTPKFSSLSTLLKPTAQVTAGDMSSLTSAFNEATELKELRLCEPEDDYIFTHLALGTADKIMTNIDGNTAVAKLGAPITHDPRTPPTSANTDRVYRPYNPAIETSDVVVGMDGSISISALLASTIASNDQAIARALLKLLAPLGILATDIKNATMELLVQWDESIESSADGRMISPAPLFDMDDSAMLRAGGAGSLKTLLEDVEEAFTKRGTGGTVLRADKIDRCKQVLQAYVDNPGAERPSNLMTEVRTTEGILIDAMDSLAQCAARLLRGRTVTVSGSDEVELIMAVKSGDTTKELYVIEDALKKGLLMYNIRKTYLLAISIMSLMIASLERAVVFIRGFQRHYDPFPDYTVADEKELLVYGFLTPDGNYCYPKVKDIDLTALNVTSVTLNQISPFVDAEDIKYDMKLTVPDSSSEEVKPMPIMGMGIGEDGQSWFTNWDTKHKYPYTRNGIFDTVARGTDPELTLSGIVPGADADCYDKLQTTLSMRDYMVYDGPKIRYINAASSPTPTSVAMSPKQFGEALDNGTSSESPNLSRTLVEGTISMSEIFTYLGTTASAEPLPLSVEFPDIHFHTSQPRGIPDSISASYVTTAPILDASYTSQRTVFTPSKFRGDVNVLRRKGTLQITKVLQHPGAVRTIFEKMKASPAQGYVFPIIGHASNTLDTTYYHGESALMAYFFKEAGCTIKSDFLDGDEISASKIATEMTDSNGSALGPNSGSLWKSHNRAVHDRRWSSHPVRARNFNLWLAKRRAYWVYIMLMSIMFYDRINEAPRWRAGRPYDEWDIVKYGTNTFRCTSAHEAGAAFDASKWTSITTSAVLSDGAVIYRNMVQYNVFFAGSQEEYVVELVYSDSATGPATAGDAVKMRPFHCYGFGSTLHKESLGNQDDRAEQRGTNMLINKPVSLTSQRVWSVTNMERNLAIPLNNDLDDDGFSKKTISARGNDFWGGWPCPRVGNSSHTGEASGNYEDKWVTTAMYISRTFNTPAKLDRLTNIHMCKVGTQVTTESNWRSLSSSKLTEIRALAKGEGDYATRRMRVNNQLHEFLSQADGKGMEAFAVPRDANSLTSKVWLVITKKP